MISVSQEEYLDDIPLLERDVENTANLYDILKQFYKESLPGKEAELVKDFDQHIKNTTDLLVRNWNSKTSNPKLHSIRVIYLD